MKKKLIFAVVITLIVVALLCSACNPKGQNSNILDLCKDISNAKSATQVITVKSGSDEIAKETRSYNFVTNKVNIERKTLNSSNEDQLYTTETETKDISSKPSVSLTKDLLTAVTETATTLKATVSNDNINQVFGIDSSNVQGNADLELVADNGHIVSITVSYISANGNTVQIVTNYVY